jgi:hypothetical protein
MKYALILPKREVRCTGKLLIFFYPSLQMTKIVAEPLIFAPLSNEV